MKRKDYIRDSHSNALLRTDKNALDQHRIRKNELQRINDTEKEIHNLRQEIIGLKELIIKEKK